ncbi:hypothetical protein BDV10DRAFT_190253 [Aspergillus recurvatus]
MDFLQLALPPRHPRRDAPPRFGDVHTPGISSLIAAFATGYLMSRIRPAWIMCMSLSAFTLGTVLIAIAPVHQTYWALTFVSLVVIPWGMDMSFPAATLMLSNAVKNEHQGLAASLVTTVVNYSISLSLGFAGTIESQITSGRIRRRD